jgi:tripartite-type tricarboxylate transporter receptor subunit TctC
MNKLLRSFCSILGAFVLFASAPVAAQDAYPSKPVRVIVGWAPGGGVDVTARTLAQYLSQAWGQQIIVENRPGAAGNLAGDLTVKASADGYTLLLGSIGELAVNVSLFKNMPYDPLANMSQVAMAVRVPNILVVHPTVASKNVRELVEFSKAGQGLTFASPGNGSIGHLTGELLRTVSGAKLIHVPYKGAAPAVADLVGGQVQLAFSSMPAVLPHVKAGKLRALAVTASTRVAAVPDLPTIAESGYPGFDAVGWYAFVGPAGMPKQVVDKLNADVNRVLRLPEVKEKLTAQGLEPWEMAPDEFRSYTAAEISRWSKLVRDSGSKVD